MFQTKVVGKTKTHIFCSTTFFLNRTVYEILWKNSVQPDRPQMTIWRIRIECSIPKANTHTHTHTHTLRICNTYCFATATMVARTRLNVTSHVHCLYCCILQTNVDEDTRRSTSIKRGTTGTLYSWKFEDAFTTPIMEMTVTISSHSNVSMCLRRNSVEMRHVSQIAKSAYQLPHGSPSLRMYKLGSH